MSIIEDSRIDLAHHVLRRIDLDVGARAHRPMHRVRAPTHRARRILPPLDEGTCRGLQVRQRLTARVVDLEGIAAPHRIVRVARQEPLVSRSAAEGAREAEGHLRERSR